MCTAAPPGCAETSGTVPGDIRMYLYAEGTGRESGGTNDIHVSLGDTVNVEVFVRNNRQLHVSAIGFFLTLTSNYLRIVPQGINEDQQYYYGQPKPFRQGLYFRSANGQVPPWGNNTHGDTLSTADNGINGWQMDYVEITPIRVGQPRPYSNLRYGVVATFQLVAVAPCDSVTLALDTDQYHQRVSSYYEPEAADSYYFQSFTPCYITVTGIEINPPLPDITMAPSTTDSSLDLDEYVGVSSIPDSLFVWLASGNDFIGVEIDPETHVVTFTAPESFHGIDDIVFSVGTIESPAMSADTLRVTVNGPPRLDRDAIPDTLYIAEDVRTGVLDLEEVVSDPDDAYNRLNWLFRTTGGKVTAQVEADSLYLTGLPDYHGRETLTIAVYDVYAAGDSLVVPVVVTPVNDAPVFLTLPGVTVTRTESAEFNLSPYLRDPDGDALTLSWDEPGNILVDQSGMMLTLTGSPGFLGSETITLTAVDPGGLSASAPLAVTVTRSNRPPVWAAIPKVGFAQSEADSTIVLWDFVADPDDPDSLLTFVITGADDIDEWWINPLTGRLALSDTDNRVGWDRLLVTATDPDGNMGSQSFIVFVAPADGTPIVGGIPDTTLVAGTETSWIDLDNYYYDVNNSDAQMTWTWSRQAGADSSVTVAIHSVTHRVTLSTFGPDRWGINRIIFTATDLDGKFGDDISIVTVLGPDAGPLVDLPAKVGFAAGDSVFLDLDDYAQDPNYSNAELTWSWRGNLRAVITAGAPSVFNTRPVTITGAADWIGWDRVAFNVRNPLGVAASDTMLVFSVSPDGTPLAGGLSGLTLKAGTCVQVRLDDYVYDADDPEYSLAWSASGTDSITISIDPQTRVAQVCALSETWAGSETVTFTVRDPDGHTADMTVPVTVTDAVLRNVFRTMLFRNPMQEDYFDLFVESAAPLSAAPTIDVRAADDSVRAAVATVAAQYYHSRYTLPLDLSIGATGTGTVIVTGRTALNATVPGVTVQDTTYFGYGYAGAAGARIVAGRAAVTIPPGALVEPVLLTLVPDASTAGAAKAAGEVRFAEDGYTLGPEGTTFVRPVRVSVAGCAGCRGAGLYRVTEQGFEWIGAGARDEALSADMDVAGTFRIGYDTTPPRVSFGRTDETGVRLAVEDNGAGVDPASCVVRAAGIPLDARMVDGAITISTAELERAGTALLEVTLADRAGNMRTERIALEGAAPGLLLVEQNAPNPFNPITTIAFTVTDEVRVSIEVYDLLGRRVRTLLSERVSAGRHTLVWDARDDGGRVVSSGVYLCRISRGDRAVTRKMLYLR